MTHTDCQPATSSTPATLPDDNLDIPAPIAARLAARAQGWRGRYPGPAAWSAGATVLVRRGRMPGRRHAIAFRSVCGVVRTVAAEIILYLGCGGSGADRRFAEVHIRQIAMYVCHVVLQITMTDIGVAFGRDRTTVGHACARVEDRRDDAAYDGLVAAIERVVDATFAPVRH